MSLPSGPAFLAEGGLGVHPGSRTSDGSWQGRRGRILPSGLSTWIGVRRLWNVSEGTFYWETTFGQQNLLHSRAPRGSSLMPETGAMTLWKALRASKKIARQFKLCAT